MAYVRCKHLDADHANRILSDHGCLVEVPQPILPASITEYRGFRWPPERGFVTKEHCAKCPMFEPKGD